MSTAEEPLLPPERRDIQSAPNSTASETNNISSSVTAGSTNSSGNNDGSSSSTLGGSPPSSEARGGPASSSAPAPGAGVGAGGTTNDAGTNTGASTATTGTSTTSAGLAGVGLGHGSTQNVRVTATIRTQNIPTNNNNGEVPQQTQNLFHMRDRLFLALFFRVTLIYARACPKTLRRFIEFCLLIQSISLLFMLGYIHVVYTRTPITCLQDYQSSWPRDGILRVEITPESPEDYDLKKSYEKEEKLRQRAASSQIGHYSDDFLTMMFAADTLLLEKMVTTAGEIIKSVTSKSSNSNVAEEAVTSPESTAAPEFTESPALLPSETISATSSPTAEDGSSPQEDQDSSTATPEPPSDASGNDAPEKGTFNHSSKEAEEDLAFPTAGGAGEGEPLKAENGAAAAADAVEDETISPSFAHTASGSGSVGASYLDVDHDPESLYFNKTLEQIEIMKMHQKKLEEEAVLKSSVSDFEMFANSVWGHDQVYIVEYSLEYGFLRLSPETRTKLNIPVKIVTLDPTKEKCFGDTFSRFLLDNFLGYDDVLMSSIKNLAESEDNKGYLRNVVTGEQFRFVPMWMSRSSYIPAFLIMLVFTVSISMLLRYSHHQIFVFIVDLLNNIEGAGAIHIPAAPLFTVILALVGMEAIMSEFFNDTSTAFYVILIVWIADQYDSVCSHTNITKTYWVRFFYLYHFAFYAYHYRFNGQYGGLALLVSWSFIQHSMVYFYHHYELPAILRQAAHQDPASDLDDEAGAVAAAAAAVATGQLRPLSLSTNISSNQGSNQGPQQQQQSSGGGQGGQQQQHVADITLIPSSASPSSSSSSRQSGHPSTIMELRRRTVRSSDPDSNNTTSVTITRIIPEGVEGIISSSAASAPGNTPGVVGVESTPTPATTATIIRDGGIAVVPSEAALRSGNYSVSLEGFPTAYQIVEGETPTLLSRENSAPSSPGPFIPSSPSGAGGGSSGGSHRSIFHEQEPAGPPHPVVVESSRGSRSRLLNTTTTTETLGFSPLGSAVGGAVDPSPVVPSPPSPGGAQPRVIVSQGDLTMTLGVRTTPSAGETNPETTRRVDSID